MYTEHYDVYIGRAGKGMTGLFGNPYAVGENCKRCGALHKDRASTLPCFREYLDERAAKDNAFRLQLLRLRGKTLGCPGACKPEYPCHGDVIATWIEDSYQRKSAVEAS